MKRLEGGYLGGRPTWSLASNPGIWGIEQVYARRVAGTWPIGAGSFDEYYEYVTFMLHANGANGSTSFPDSSLLGNAVAVNGNAQVSTAQSKFGGSSISFDGSGDYLVASSSSAFALQAGDWTIEFWIYFNALSGTQNIIDFRTTSGSAVCPTIYTNGTSLALAVGGSNVITPADVLITGSWYHIAVAKSAGSTRMFLNGTQVGSTYADSNSYVNNSSLNIGRYPVSNVSFVNGYIDELRITKGYARYTSNFSVPTGPYEDEGAPLADPFYNYVSLLLPMNGSNNSTTFTDRSPNALTVTANGDAKLSTAVKRYGTSSAVFDGTGDYLTIGTASSFNFLHDGSTWTIEAWIKINTFATSQVILDTCRGATANRGVFIQINTNRTIRLAYFRGVAATFVLDGSFATALPNNTDWHHMAITFDLAPASSNAVLFIDGVNSGSLNKTANAPGTSNAAGAMFLGTFDAASEWFNGYIDDLRITKGVARYLGNFIPPLPHADYGTLADPYLGATSLLMPMEGPVNSTGFFDRAKRLPATTYGNAKVSNAQYKWGLTSAFFDGSNDGLTVPSSSGFDFGTGDFTIEFWVYPTALSGANRGIVCKGWPNYGSWLVYYNNTSNRLELYVSSNNTAWDIASAQPILTTPSLNRWYHIAITRSGTAFRAFIDGAQTLTFTSSASIYYSASQPVGIGGDQNGANSMGGYIDDLRIIKGHARYTTNFTPPTAPINADTSSDPHLSNVSLLLKMDGANNSTTFTDSSLTPKAVFANGDAKISTAQSKFGGSSALFDGTGDYLEIPRSSDFAFGTGDFTVEFWLRVTAVPAGLTLLLDFRSAGADVAPALYLATTTRELTYFTNNANRIVGSSVPLATWVHVALSRSAANTRLFVDGLQVGSTYSDANNYVSSALIVGAGFNYADSLNGYIDDLRITKGVARYTANFIPPTISHPVWPETDASFSSVSLLLNGNGANASTVVADRSSNASTVVPNGNAQISTTQSRFGGSSLYFDGTGDYLAIPTSSIFAFGGADFTIEFWVFRVGTGQQHLYEGRNGNATNTGLIYIDTSLELRYYVNAAVAISTGYTVPANVWVHVALSRSGSSTKMFVNGAQVGSTYTDTINYNAPAGSVLIGTNDTATTTFLNGYIDDLRVTKGVARYTTNFTHPVAPHLIPVIDPYFGAVSLLLHMNGANASTTFPDHSYNALAVTANGNAQISTAQSKFGGSSALFDGTTDYLTVASSASFALFAGDFTVEFWVRLNGTTNNQAVVQLSSSGTERANISVVSDLIVLYTETGGNGVTRISGTAPSTSTWHHVAWTRDGTTSRLFLNGTSVGTATSAPYPSGNMAVSIGANDRTSGANCLDGYIDDLRITKGVARYTANFTPPATQFPNS